MLCLVLLVAAAVAIAAGLHGRGGRDEAAVTRPRSRELALTWGLAAVYLGFLALLVASAVLLHALLAGDTGFRYVVENWDPSLSTLYRISAFWAGQQGSFLLWALLLLGAAAVVALRGARIQRELGSGAALVLALAGAALVLLMLVDRGSDPFAAAPQGATPAGLNPLLLHPAMALHPPALFLGYVGLAVPFAYAVSALWLRRLSATWARMAHGWALAGWVFLSIGIGLGAWWAYVILSWGGYWGWDAVENTSLVPWLTATALLHSLSVYNRAPVFRRWAASLAVLTFWLTIMATWTTRTGLVQSLHAFDQRTTLVVALSLALGAVALVGIWLIARRWRLLASPAGQEPRMAHGARDVMHEITNVALTAFAGAILFATVIMPLAFGKTIQASTYDLLARPLGAVTVALLGTCPLLWSGGAPSARSAARRLLAPAAVAVAAAVLLAFSGWAGSIGGLVSLAVSVFAVAAATEWLVIRAGTNGATSSVRSMWRAISGSRSATGGLITHIGMALILAGLVGTSYYAVRDTVSLPVKEGASARVGGYTLTFTAFTQSKAPQGGQRVAALLRVSRGGETLGTVTPSLDVYGGGQQTVARASILGGAWRDLFVSPQSFSAERLTVDVIVFPLVRLLWAGIVVLVLGGIVALLPRSAPVAMTAVEPAVSQQTASGTKRAAT